MPWYEKDKMCIKLELIQELLSNKNSVTSICKEYNISRKTAYKWLERYQLEGVLGLEERSRAPTRVNITDSEVVQIIINKRKEEPEWGARKTRQVLINEGYEVPSEATFNRIFKKYDLIKKDESEKRKPYIRFERSKPNELWQMDFKGHFQLKEGRCHPLTVLDDHSRFSICLKAFAAEEGAAVKNALTDAFREYGLPDAMTMDNGSPGRGGYQARFSRLTIWLMKLGIKVSHSSPRHPQTQGKDERFHRTLKHELLKYYQFKDLADTQAKFNEWRYKYNFIRPHEGINLARPADRYSESLKPFPEIIKEIEYPDMDEVRKVQLNGCIEVKQKKFFIGEHFYQEYVGLKQISDTKYEVYYVNCRIGSIDLKQ